MSDQVGSGDGLEELADTLWSERHLVEYLLFKLVSAKLLLAADERRFVAAAIEEVERVVAALRDAEQRRSAAVADVAASWGVAPDAVTLERLARRSPPALRAVFGDHRQAFRRLAAEIEETAAANRRLADAALGHVRGSLEVLAGGTTVATYDASGRRATASRAAGVVDQAL